MPLPHFRLKCSVEKGKRAFWQMYLFTYWPSENMSEWPGQLTHCMRKSFTRSNLAVRKLPTISIVILKVKVEKRASKPRAMSVARFVYTACN